MNLRSSKINLEKLISLTTQVTEKLNQAEDSDYFFIIGNPGLRNKNNKINYLMAKESHEHITSLIFPEIHKTKEGIAFCECPDFYYSARTREEKLTQAMSLEIAVKMAIKIHGFVIIINYDDLYTARGSTYKNLIKILTNLFNSNFEEFFTSCIFVITNKPKKFDKNNFLKFISSNVKILQEELLFEEDEEFFEENESVILAKMELVFSRLIISHENQVLILDESDNGESRMILLEALSNISSIESCKLNFESLYSNLLKGIEFNLRKFIDDALNKTSSCEFRKVI